MYGGNLPTTGFTATIYAVVGLVLVVVGVLTAFWSRLMRWI
ncbi:MAG TPA: LPXTG cell wall anchor domain-containing protein [Streptosporangiaceae bacterium]